MDFSLLLNYQDVWNDALSYAVSPLLGVEPLTFISPVVEYNNNLYVANYANGVNPPVGVTPDDSDLWTLFVSGAESSGVTSFNTRTGAVVSATNDYAFSQISGVNTAVKGGTGLSAYTPGDLIVAASNTTLTTLTGAAIGCVMISNGPGVAPSYSGSPTVGRILLTNLTSQIVLGTTTTTTLTMSTLTSSRTFTLPDANSNPVQPSSAPTNQFANGISGAGVIQYAQPTFANFGYTIVHKVASWSFLASQITVIMDADAQTGTLPDPTTVIPAVTYTLKLGAGATTGTLAVPSGASLDGVLNGTFALSGSTNSASAQSDGTAWYTV